MGKESYQGHQESAHMRLEYELYQRGKRTIVPIM